MLNYKEGFMYKDNVTILDLSNGAKQQSGIDSMLIVAKMVIWITIGLLILSCEPAVEPTRRFITYKGEHYSWPRVTESLQTNSLKFDARFNETAIYDFGDQALQSDKNKLMGLCDCNSTVHQNSARFAWQWFNNRLEIYGYTYVNGVRQEQFVGVVNVGEFNHYEISLTDSHYVFKLNGGEPVYMQRGKGCTTGVYLKLWPYFGGHVPAPHDVSIDIKYTY